MTEQPRPPHVVNMSGQPVRITAVLQAPSTAVSSANQPTYNKVPL